MQGGAGIQECLGGGPGGPGKVQRFWKTCQVQDVAVGQGSADIIIHGPNSMVYLVLKMGDLVRHRNCSRQWPPQVHKLSRRILVNPSLELIAPSSWIINNTSFP